MITSFMNLQRIRYLNFLCICLWIFSQFFFLFLVHGALSKLLLICSLNFFLVSEISPFFSISSQFL